MLMQSLVTPIFENLIGPASAEIFVLVKP